MTYGLDGVPAPLETQPQPLEEPVGVKSASDVIEMGECEPPDKEAAVAVAPKITRIAVTAAARVLREGRCSGREWDPPGQRKEAGMISKSF